MKIAIASNIAITDECVQHIDFFRPAEGSSGKEVSRSAGWKEGRSSACRGKTIYPAVKAPPLEAFARRWRDRKTRKPSTTAAFGGRLQALLKNPKLGKLVVPIVPGPKRAPSYGIAVPRIRIYASQGHGIVQWTRRSALLQGSASTARF